MLAALGMRAVAELRGRREKFTTTVLVIEGALLLPANEISARAAELLPDLEQIILVYCRSGQRSAAASRTLADMGYTAVFDFGGIMQWPYGVVTGVTAVPTVVGVDGINDVPWSGQT